MAKNHPFFHKVKRNLYIMDQLLNDENNSKMVNTDTVVGNQVDSLSFDNIHRSNSAGPAQASIKKSRTRRGSVQGLKSSNFGYSSIMKWSFKNNPNAEFFRRSMLPFYLLKDDSGW